MMAHPRLDPDAEVAHIKDPYLRALLRQMVEVENRIHEIPTLRRRHRLDPDAEVAHIKDPYLRALLRQMVEVENRIQEI